MNQNPVLRTALQYGAYSGIGSFIYFLIVYYAGHNPLAGPITWVGSAIPIVFIVLGTKHFREFYLEGFIAYKKALGIGMFITLAAAVLFSLLIYIFGTVIDSKIVEMYINESLDAMEKGKGWLGNEFYEKALDQITKTTMRDISWGDFYKTVIGGFIVSLVVAGIYSKEKPFFEKDANEQH